MDSRKHEIQKRIERAIRAQRQRHAHGLKRAQGHEQLRALAAIALENQLRQHEMTGILDDPDSKALCSLREIREDTVAMFQPEAALRPSSRTVGFERLDNRFDGAIAHGMQHQLIPTFVSAAEEAANLLGREIQLAS